MIIKKVFYSHGWLLALRICFQGFIKKKRKVFYSQGWLLAHRICFQGFIKKVFYSHGCLHDLTGFVFRLFYTMHGFFLTGFVCRCLSNFSQVFFTMGCFILAGFVCSVTNQVFFNMGCFVLAGYFDVGLPSKCCSPWEASSPQDWSLSITTCFWISDFVFKTLDMIKVANHIWNLSENGVFPTRCQHLSIYINIQSKHSICHSLYHLVDLLDRYPIIDTMLGGSAK